MNAAASAAPLRLTVLEDFEHVDDTLDDSAWYDRYTIKVGTYDVVARGDEAVIEVDATLVEEYRTTRLMSRNKAEARSVYEETTFAFRASSSDALGGPLLLSGAYAWVAPAGARTPTAAAIASVVAEQRAATTARRAVGAATGSVGPEYADALAAEAAERAAAVARAQAAA
ncbi:hypothetical protein [Frondihabitans cladoniiphilus]|uniref:Polyketide cyclase/dehydrase/lipid transport protein n=1 Tax=Frondihabitans cladoniiphilus TaxID=715785 RepID=A0ABP8VMQ0_9MICO